MADIKTDIVTARLFVDESTQMFVDVTTVSLNMFTTSLILGYA